MFRRAACFERGNRGLVRLRDVRRRFDIEPINELGEIVRCYIWNDIGFAFPIKESKRLRRAEQSIVPPTHVFNALFSSS